MTNSGMPPRRRAAALARRFLCTMPMRLAIIVGVVVASAGSSHAATPSEVRVTGAGPGVLLIPGQASCGAVRDDTARRLCQQRRCHVFALE